jgi:hypothetical protein
LSPQEKARLANLFEWKGRPPAELAAAQQAALPRKKKSEKEQLEEMFSRVLREVEERRDFMQVRGCAFYSNTDLPSHLSVPPYSTFFTCHFRCF